MAYKNAGTNFWIDVFSWIGRQIKKLFAIIALIVIAQPSLQAQTVNDVPLSEIDVEYVLIVGTAKFLSTKIKVQIDFGQDTKLFSGMKDVQLRDADNKPVIFNSMIDALNFMSKAGYDYIDNYLITVGNQNVYHYILRKRSE